MNDTRLRRYLFPKVSYFRESGLVNVAVRGCVIQHVNLEFVNAKLTNGGVACLDACWPSALNDDVTNSSVMRSGCIDRTRFAYKTVGSIFYKPLW